MMLEMINVSFRGTIYRIYMTLVCSWQPCFKTAVKWQWTDFRGQKHRGQNFSIVLNFKHNLSMTSWYSKFHWEGVWPGGDEGGMCQDEDDDSHRFPRPNFLLGAELRNVIKRKLNIQKVNWPPVVTFDEEGCLGLVIAIILWKIISNVIPCQYYFFPTVYFSDNLISVPEVLVSYPARGSFSFIQRPLHGSSYFHHPEKTEI